MAIHDVRVKVNCKRDEGHTCIALMLSEARIASLSANVGSSFGLGIRADTITHISHRLMFTARRSALDRGEP